MDTFSHALWGYGLFGWRRFALWAAFWGAMPDLISFGILLLIRVLDGSYHPGPPPLETIPEWLFFTYSLGHSFLISLPIIGVVALWRKSFAFAMLAWPFHIVLDFPFHSFKYFPTPIFWPISDFKINGIPWSNPWIWGSNVAGLVLLFWFRKRQGRKTTA